VYKGLKTLSIMNKKKFLSIIKEKYEIMKCTEIMEILRGKFESA
jgi:hypothetical protein